MRYGVHKPLPGMPPGRLSGEVLGAIIGYSRERARQFSEMIIQAARGCDIVAPAFDALALTGTPFYPSPAEERRAQEVRGDGLCQSDVALFMKKVLGRATTGEELLNVDREIEQRRVDVETDARSMIAWAGAAYMQAIPERAQKGGARPAEVAALRQWVCGAPGYEGLGEGDAHWFWSGSTQPSQNLVVRVVRQLLSVAGKPVPVARPD